MKILFVLSIALLTTLTGCLYKMPTDNCISTLPNMNNPTITGEKPSQLMLGR